MLPESYEPLLLEESTVSLLEMIEDELILLLPLVAKHNTSECHVEQDFAASPALVHDEPTEDQNPFAALEQLKKTK